MKNSYRIRKLKQKLKTITDTNKAAILERNIKIDFCNNKMKHQNQQQLQEQKQ